MAELVLKILLNKANLPSTDLAKKYYEKKLEKRLIRVITGLYFLNK